MFVDTYSNGRKAQARFFREDGLPTAYALHCGRTIDFQSDWNGETVRVQVWHEGGVYHVRQHSDERGRILWESFETYTEALVFARKLKAEMRYPVKPGSHKFLFGDDAKNFARAMRRRGWSCRIERHLGIAFPHRIVQWKKPKKP